MNNNLVLYLAETTSSNFILSSMLILSFLSISFLGIAQGLIKLLIKNIDPSRFCLFFVIAKILVNTAYFVTNDHPNPFDNQGIEFMFIGVLGYILEGLGWITFLNIVIYYPIMLLVSISSLYIILSNFISTFVGLETISINQYISLFIALISLNYIYLLNKNNNLSYSIIDLKKLSLNKNSENDIVNKCSLGGKCASNRSCSVKASKKFPLVIYTIVFWTISQILINYSFNLPNASQTNMLIYNSVGSALTLGTYGLFYGLRCSISSMKEVGKAFLPMFMISSGYIFYILSKDYIGEQNILISKLFYLYPIITIIFAFIFLKEKINKEQWILVLLILLGIQLS